MKRIAEELSIAIKLFSKDFSVTFTKILSVAQYICFFEYGSVSNVLLEALGFGIPTISIDYSVGGSRLLIENDINEILVYMLDM